MNKLYRIIDANINRASEGLRVMEDLSRFYYEAAAVSEKLKIMRHGIRKNIKDQVSECISARDSENDIGLDISMQLKIDDKTSIDELVAANFKRVQEALRVIEESLKVVGKYEISKIYEDFRFNSYQLEKDFYIVACISSKKSKLDTDLYCLTAEEYSKGKSNIEVIRSMIKAGIKIIQYREKDKKLLHKYNECIEIRKLTKEAGVTFIINDDVDIAMLVKTDGVHIGQDDIPPEKVRELVGKDMIIGLSTHSLQQAQNALKSGVDYIGVGPIFRTFTKKDVCEPVGLEYLEYVVKNIDIPFVAIGGIKEDNVCEVRKRGAKCVAMVTEIVAADNIEEKISSVRNKMRGV